MIRKIKQRHRKLREDHGATAIAPVRISLKEEDKPEVNYFETHASRRESVLTWNVI